MNMNWRYVLCVVIAGAVLTVSAPSEAKSTFNPGDFFRATHDAEELSFEIFAAVPRANAGSTDPIAPVVEATIPADGSSIDAGFVDIGGEVLEAESGIESVEVRVQRLGVTPAQYWNGNAWTIASTYPPAFIDATGTAWTLPQVDLNAPGNYRVRIVARDIAGNVSGAVDNPKTDFKILSSDQTKPLATVTSPVNGAEIGAGGIDLQGSITETGSGIARVKVRIQRLGVTPSAYWNGSSWSEASAYPAASINSAGTVWTLSDVDLSTPGNYRVRIVAVDIAGNVSGAVDNPKTDFKILSSDQTKPLATVTSLVNGAEIGAGSIDLQGSIAETGSGIARVKVRIQRLGVTPSAYWNGSSWSEASTYPAASINSAGTVWTLSDVDLSTPGNYRVRIVAVDIAGNVSGAVDNPKTDFKILSSDQTKPLATVTSPVNGAEIGAGSIDLQGSIAETGSGIARVKVRIQRLGVTPSAYWNGSSWSEASAYPAASINSAGTVWTLSDVDLSTPGNYRVRIVAVDIAGNKASAIDNPKTDFSVKSNVDNIPTAFPDFATVQSGDSVNIDVLANDEDDTSFDGAVITFSDMLPLYGAVSVVDNKVLYEHNGSDGFEFPQDLFSYRVTDQQGGQSALTNVTVSITDINSAPLVVDDSVSVAVGNSVLVTPLANDNDPDNPSNSKPFRSIDPTTLQVISSASLFGEAVANSDGTILYTHDGSSGTQASFQYTVADKQGAVSAPATVSIIITPLSDGSWGNVIPMPAVPMAAANLPDGRVMTWASFKTDYFEPTTFNTNYTYTSIFDPVTEQSDLTLVTNTEHDMFCPGTNVLADGRVLVAGGTSWGQSSIFDVQTNTWSEAEQMNIPRAYQGNTMLSDGSVFTLGGSWRESVGCVEESETCVDKAGEVWTEGSGWRVLNGVPAAPFLTNDIAGQWRADNQMWLFSVEGGDVLHAGPSKNMHMISTGGAGSYTSVGLRADDDHAMNGNAVMYDIGKVLTVGGMPDYDYGAASDGAFVIEVDNGAVTSRRISDMNNPRVFHNSTVLPSGEVVVLGGQSVGILFSDANSILTAELWNPQTETFRELASMTVPRNYHSVALLLDDGRVMTGGGGLCGSCATNHPDVQIFSPPYLFDGSGNLATRPQITSAPSSINHGSQITVQTDSPVQSIVLMRSASVTHSVNNSQRRVPLSFTASGGNSYQAQIPSDDGVLIPGNYMLFVIDGNGVPSLSSLVNVTIASTNAAPVAVNDSSIVPAGDSVTIDLVGNDSDPDNPAGANPARAVNPDSIVLVSSSLQQLNGDVVVNSNGTVVFTHDNSAGSTETFQYTVADFHGKRSSVGSVEVIINDPPIANDDTFYVASGATAVLALAANDVDSDGAVVLGSITFSQPSYGSVSLQNGIVEYAHSGGQLTTDSFTYTIADDDGSVSNEATVAINVYDPAVNQSPIASVDQASVAPGGVVDIVVLANDIDVDGSLDASGMYIGQVVPGEYYPQSGTLAISASGVISYEHYGGPPGVDSFHYVVPDNDGAESTPTLVTINIGSSSSTPIAVNDAANLLAGGETTIDVLSNDMASGSSLDAATVTTELQPSHGTAVPQSNGTILYTHNDDGSTSDSFTYTVESVDGDLSNTAVVQITIDASSLIAGNDTAGVVVGDSVSIAVLDNDSAGAQSLNITSVVIEQQPANGSAVPQSNGTVLYTHNENGSTSDSFTYTVENDLGETSNAATVSVAVIPEAGELFTRHTSGQTFLTWQETGESDQYHVYRHTVPLSSASLGSAVRVTNKWGPLGNDTSVNKTGGPNVPANYVVENLGAPLSDATGLFVYTTQSTDSNTAYYGVVPVVNGVEMTAALITHTVAVNELVAVPADVLTVSVNGGKGRIYTQYMDYSNWNPTFNGYIYNYSVAAPHNYDPTQAYPLVIVPHAYGEVYKFVSEAEFEWEVIQLFPHDPGEVFGLVNSWWYGYSADHNYITDTGNPDSGFVENFTEQRVMRSVDELLGNSFYNIDQNLIHAYGNSMGGSGVLAWGMRYPSLLAGVFASLPMTNYEDSVFAADEFQQLWGADGSGQLPIVNRGPHTEDIALYGEQGVQSIGVWDWMDHHEQLVDRRGDEFAYLMTLHGKADTTIDWLTQGKPTVRAFTDANVGFSAINGLNGHVWVGFDPVVKQMFGFGYDADFAWKYPLNLSFPAIQNAEKSDAVDPQDTGIDEYNQDIEWATAHTQFDTVIVDTANLYEITLRSISGSQTADITPRRTQNFSVNAAVQCNWTATNRNDLSSLGSGVVTADIDSLVTVPAVNIVSGIGTRLAISCP